MNKHLNSVICALALLGLAINSTSATAADGANEPKDGLTLLAEEGFWLQLGPGVESPDSGPATFSFSRDVEGGGDTQFNAAFTLGFSPARRVVRLEDDFSDGVKTSPNIGQDGEVLREGASRFFNSRNTTWTWSTSVQGQLTAAENEAANAWIFRLGADILNTSGQLTKIIEERARIGEKAIEEGRDAEFVSDVLKYEAIHGSPNDLFYIGSRWSTNAKLEADQDFNNQRASFELEVAPFLNLPGNGIWWPHLSKKAPIRFAWQPYFGIDAGGQIASDGTLDAVDDSLRLTGRLTAAIRFDAVQRALGLNGVVLSVEDRANYLAESGKGFNWVTATLDFKLTKHLGFGITYVNGAQAPNFEQAESWNGGFTVKF